MKFISCAILLLCLMPSSAAFSEEVLVPDPRHFSDVAVEHAEDEFEGTRRIHYSFKLDSEQLSEAVGYCACVVDVTQEKSGEWTPIRFFFVVLSSKKWVNSELPGEQTGTAIFLVDGSRIEVPYSCNTSLEPTDDRPFQEFSQSAFSPRFFVNLTNAKKISARYGNVDVDFSKENLHGLRSFAANLPRTRILKDEIKTDPASTASFEAIERNKTQMKANAVAQSQMQEDERRAHSALSIIKRSLIGKNTNQAIQALNELIKKYPGTKSAEEARKTLEELK